MRPTAVILLVQLVVAAAGGACTRSTRSDPADTPGDIAAWSPDPDAFLPARLRVNPLTRVSRDRRDDPGVVVCHFELRDGHGQVVKCLGLASVQLVRADAQGKPASGDREDGTTWRVDLRDPGANAAAFDDVVTRCYVVKLGSLPPSLADLGPESDTALAVRVRFIFKDAAGNPREVESAGPLTIP